MPRPKPRFQTRATNVVAAVDRRPDPYLRRRSAARGASATAALAGLVLVADVATKTWAATRLSNDPVSLLGGQLVLTESRNPGAAFGLGTSLTPLLALLAGAVVVAVAVAARRPHPAPVSVALGLLGGGAAGNVVDRLFREPGPLRGHVVDWIDVGAWPTFNLADSAITCAVVLMVSSVLLHGADRGVPHERGRSRS